ncbi:MAG: MOSC domain-containing protein [Candidatus Eremiobacteraeota bacterium]|nr:MOSC domain-containing protein [Candidatus Eremiobacteraeota bacterium]
MRLLAVNVGKARPMEGRRQSKTGIFKTAVEGAVAVGLLGLEGDVQVNKKHHGGPDQAIYLYAADDYAWWSKQLARELEPGTFGENLTLDSFGPEPLATGDRLRLGEVLLELTAPRVPCATLAARMGDPGFVKRFRQARRPGAYARVLEPGQLEAGLAANWEARGKVALDELFELVYQSKAAPERLEAALRAPLASRMRELFESRLD